MPNPFQLVAVYPKISRVGKGHAPLYSSKSKFSQHIFTQLQRIVRYFLKLKMGVTYRELIDGLLEMPHIRQALGLAGRLRLEPFLRQPCLTGF